MAAHFDRACWCASGRRQSLRSLWLGLLRLRPRARPAPGSTLTTSGAVCIDKFNALVRTQYGNDTSCSTLIRSALSTADPTKCPEGTQGSGSAVQKCMAKVAVSGSDRGRLGYQLAAPHDLMQLAALGCCPLLLPSTPFHVLTCSAPPTSRCPGSTLCATARS